jgi:hypothetical protein
MDRLKAFAQSFRRNYPAGWLLLKVELSHQRMVHVHALGDFGSGGMSEWAEWLTRTWAKITRNSDPEATHITEARDAHHGYLVKATKRGEDVETARFFDGRQTTRWIGKAHVPDQRIRSACVSEATHKEIQRLLAEELHRQAQLRGGVVNEKQLGRIMAGDFRHDFIPPTLMAQIMELIEGGAYSQCEGNIKMAHGIKDIFQKHLSLKDKLINLKGECDRMLHLKACVSTGKPN